MPVIIIMSDEGRPQLDIGRPQATPNAFDVEGAGHNVQQIVLKFNY